MCLENQKFKSTLNIKIKNICRPKTLASRHLGCQIIILKNW